MVVTAALLALPWAARSPAQEDSAPAPEEDVAELFRSAEKALAAREPELAESLLRDALREAWLVRASLHSSAGEAEAALRAYSRARSVSAEARRPALGLALVEFEAGRLEEAARWLRKVLARSPYDPLATEWMTHVLAAQGHEAEAVEELRGLFAATRNAETRGTGVHGTGKGRAWSPRSRELGFTLATGLLRLGRFAEAEDLLSQLADEDPRAENLVLIGRTLQDFGRHAQARGYLEEALSRDPDVRRGHLYLGSAILRLDGAAGLDAAIAAFRRELELDPSDPWASLHLGLALSEARRYTDAIEPLRVAADHPRATPDAFHYLGTSLLRSGRVAEAVDALTRGLELARRQAAPQEQLSSLHYQLATALRQDGSDRRAKVHFEAAKASSERWVQSARDQMAAFLERSAPEEPAAAPQAQALGSLVAPRFPSEDPRRRSAVAAWLDERIAEGYYNLGLMLLQRGRSRGASELLEIAAGTGPPAVRVQHALGLAYFQSGRFESARAPLEAAAARAREDLQLRRTLAMAHLNSGHFTDARDLLEDDPGLADDPSLLYALVLAQIESGREDEARHQLDRLFDRHPDWPPLYVLLAQAEAQAGDYEAAREHLLEALDRDEDVLDAHGALGMIALREGRLEDAEDHLRRELEQQPESLRLHHLLATVLERGREPGRAVPVLREVLRREPRHTDARYLLGKIQLSQGKLDQAEGNLRAAASQAPEDWNVHYQLGLCLQRQGRPEEAREAFERYRGLKGVQGKAPESPQGPLEPPSEEASASEPTGGGGR